jgi:SET domain
MYSKMNHSCCDWNTFNSIGVGDDACIEVYASRGIAKGEEVLTSYLHGIETTTFKRRRKSLLQYLFHCDCNLCFVDKILLFGKFGAAVVAL